MTGTTHITGGLIASAITIETIYSISQNQVLINGIPENTFLKNTQHFSTLFNGMLFDKYLSITAILIILFGVLGSLFPDIDIKNSKIGHKAKGISFVLNKFFGHRGFIHSPFLYCTIYLAFFCLYTTKCPIEYHSLYYAANTGFLMGALSHLILDTFNKVGIPWFMPFSTKRINIACIKTRSQEENIFEIIQITILAMYLLFSSGVLNNLPT